MRYVIALLMMMTAAAAYDGCNTELIELVDYRITPVDDDTNRLLTTFRSHADHPIRMIDASAGFSDALGGRIASFAITRDLDIQPGDEFKQTGLWGPYTFERLLTLKKEEVEGRVCVRSVLYEDGTKEIFNE